MIAKLTLDSSQIKYYAQSALYSFETLDLEMAAECAKCNLQTLLRYLDAFDNENNTVSILIVGDIKPNIVIESIIGNDNR